MPKKFKKTPKPCQSHLFSLKPDPNQDKSPRPINLTLSFCSRNAEGEREAQEQVQCIEAPIYNDDRSFASPAFILPCDKVKPNIVRVTTSSEEIKCWTNTS